MPSLRAAGRNVETALCEHFSYSRQDLFDIVKVKGIRTFGELIREYGSGHGCETCKPAAASIFASLWNESVTERSHHTLQDTNDRFLANMQRGGLYSVVPRVPGGEITPEKLIVLGNVARKFGLYTKITGAQRVDLFGAQLHQLPSIWEDLVAAGFESGHAYGKALRTIKSCVGTTWCRYGVQDSVGFAVRIERRYRGIRAPHKVKGAVSGCVRECAEAQSKDIGLIATESGYNLYVCGNGGAKPRHAKLLASDLDEESAIRYIDRFFMYYISTADKLTRTAVWLDQVEGGIDHVRDVVVHDKLGIGEELERRMQSLVESYRCEWKDVVDDPDRRRLFRQFVNTDETDAGIEIIAQRGQNRPADWPRDSVPLDQVKLADGRTLGEQRSNGNRKRSRKLNWLRVGRVSDFPRDARAAVKVGRTQIAVFNLHLPRGVAGVSEHVPAQECLCALARHRRQRRPRAQGCLPAAQEGVLARYGRLPLRRSVFREGVPGADCRGRGVPAAAAGEAAGRAAVDRTAHGAGRGRRSRCVPSLPVTVNVAAVARRVGEGRESN